MLILTLMAQSGIRWRPDGPSLLLGLIIGVLLVLFIQKFWPLVRRWRQRVAGRVEETRAWVRSGIDTRYRQELATYLEHYHLLGQQASLPAVFVAPHFLAPTALVDLTQLRANGPEQLRYLWPELANRIALPQPPTVSFHHLLRNGHRVALTGESGAGKTTLLAYAAYLATTVTEREEYAFLRDRLPVFVHLAELDLTTPAAATDPLAPLSAVLDNRASALTSTGIDRYLRQSATAGILTLYLDGWNEAGPTEQQTCCRWLAQLLTAYPTTHIIAAAPLTGYGPLLELQFIPIQILPWRVGQATTYAQQWQTATQQKQHPHLPSYWQAGQTITETVLRHHLAQARETAPERQVELLELLLRPHLSGDAKMPPWFLPLMRDVWQAMACHLLTQGQVALTPTEITRLIEEYAAANEINERNLFPRWRTFSLATGLFQEWGNGRISFKSTLWRDYLAASHLAQTPTAVPLAEKLDQPIWREVIRLYVGRTGGRDLATILTQQKDKAPWYDNLFQMASWFPELPQNEPWQRPVLIQLGKMVLQSEMPYMLRYRAIAAMALTHDAGTRVFWQQLLQRPDPLLREMAVLCLTHQGAEKVIDIWNKMLTDGTPEVRRAVIWAMAWTGAAVTEKPLLVALLGNDDRLSLCVAEALAWNGGESWTILKEALHEETLTVRRAAVWGITQLDEPWAMTLLEHVQHEDREWIVKTAAQEGLTEIQSRRQLSPWVAPNPGDMPWLVQWTTRQGRGVPAAAIPLVFEMLRQAEKADQRALAALGLGQMGIKEAVAPLQTALRDPENPVVEAAFVALGLLRRIYTGVPHVPLAHQEG